MKKITADDEVEDVLKTIGVGEGKELRESSKRQSTLEKFSQLRSRNPNVSLTLENTHTAFVKADEEIDEFKDITVTTRKFEQQITDLPEDYFDYLIQRGMTNHEVGHLLYSSWPALEKYMDKVRDEEQIDTKQYLLMFKHFVNVLEDGAIEKFLRDNFRVGEEILTLRSTLHEQHYMGKEYTSGEDVEYHYPFFLAVMTAALNLGVYDNGELWKLMDENNEEHFLAKHGDSYDMDLFQDKVVPKIKEYIPKIQSEKDAEKRMKLCYELWDFVRDYIDRSTTPGKDQYQNYTNDMEGDSYAPGVPENMSKSHGDQETEPVSVSVDIGESQSPGSDDVEDASAGGELEQKGKEGVNTEARKESGDWSDEIEEIIKALGAGDGVEEIAIAEPGKVDTDRKRQSQKYARRCERIFERNLQELQRDKVKREQRRGHLDTKRMIDAARGSTRIFKRDVKGEKKNYSCMIVLDRSGSMSSRIEEVELAAGAVAYGLEANGVNTSILDTHNSMTTLSKPFGSNVENHTDTIFANRCGGGTPLTGTVKFARQRISRGRGDIPFMIIITDGRPHSPSEFKEEVRKANFPVLGLYMTHGFGDVEEQLNLYDRAVTVDADEDVNRKVINMIRGVIL